MIILFLLPIFLDPYSLKYTPILITSSLTAGVESVSVDMKENKITVTGEADPVHLAMKLRKFGFTELLSVGPAKEEKKAEGEKKEEKKAETPTVVYANHGSYVPYPYKVVTDEYNPNTCTIC